MNNKQSHGKIGTSIYHIWASMKSRCNNKKCKDYRYYGGKGVSVCARWADFKNFYEDMGDRPTDRTLDRIDGNKGYCKENCRWATHKEQQRNKASNLFVVVNGEKVLLIEWCETTGVSYNTIMNRVHNLGYKLQDAVNKSL